MISKKCIICKNNMLYMARSKYYACSDCKISYDPIDNKSWTFHYDNYLNLEFSGWYSEKEFFKILKLKTFA